MQDKKGPKTVWLKFIVPLTVLFVLLILLSPLGRVREFAGIENFNVSDSDFELTKNMFPTDDFLSIYPYQRGGYHYIDETLGSATALVYLSYDPDVYIEAKRACMESFVFCNEHQYYLGDYQLSEYLCYKSRNEEGDWHIDCIFPRWFSMYGFNDENHTLVFLGYHNSNDNDERSLAQSDFQKFINDIYAEYHAEKCK